MIEARHWRRVHGLGTTQGVPIERGSCWQLARRQKEILPPFEPVALSPGIRAEWKAVDKALSQAMATGLHEDWQAYYQVLGREW